MQMSHSTSRLASLVCFSDAKKDAQAQVRAFVHQWLS